MKNVSYYAKVSHNKSIDYSLEEWLKDTINPPKKLLKLVNNYRETLDQEDKRKLPAISISAKINGIRDLDTDFVPSGFICIDIDRYAKKGPSNPCIDMELVKEMLKEHPCTYFCGRSLSFDGIYGIIKITEGDKLGEYFDFFRDKFIKIGINIDPSCRDHTRLRFFSHDPDAYFNPNAKSYNLPKKEKPSKKPSNKSFSGKKTNIDKVDSIVSLIMKQRIDITSDYNDWIRIAGSLNSEFGENGEFYFQQISSIHPEYNEEKTRKKYKDCRKMNKTTLGTFFSICTDYGIRY